MPTPSDKPACKGKADAVTHCPADGRLPDRGRHGNTALAVSALPGIKSPNIWDYQLIFIYLQQIKNELMGTTVSILASRIARKQAYQEKKKLEDLQRIASYLSAEEREILFSGNGFVRVPEQEARRLRLDACFNT